MLYCLLLLLAVWGHVLLWVAVLNRLHAVLMPRWAMNLLSLALLALIVGGPVGFVVLSSAAGAGFFGNDNFARLPTAAWPYLGVCWLVAIVGIARWTWHTLKHRRSPILHWHRRHRFEVMPEPVPPGCEEHAHHFMVHLPGNQSLSFDRSDRALRVPRLAPALDGLSIMHLSDFHFTGRVGKAFFREIVRRSNEVEPDLVAVTGDLVDNSRYIRWLPDTLGQLRARYGVYYVLGNHDMRADIQRIREVLNECGLVDLGGRWIEIEVRGEPVILAGNELPWLAPAADLSQCPPRTPGGGALRIVLSHSPDQFDWARAYDTDLLLAGHTHGGQIRFPLLGAIVSPSLAGVKYASGLFYSPPTIMHVTRGISGELPLRLNCPPEMAHLVLHARKRAGASR